MKWSNTEILEIDPSKLWKLEKGVNSVKKGDSLLKVLVEVILCLK